MGLVVVIGGGPAGLMAAETAVATGANVEVYDAMPSMGRKFLLAGKGGLNLSHSEPMELFLSRYGIRRTHIEPAIRSFPAAALRQWARELGIETFVGTSGRIFPTDLKAAPLLRAWLHRLRKSGVQFHTRHRWRGWDERGNLLFSTPQGPKNILTDAVVLALGGGSWPHLGSNAAWLPILAERQVAIEPLKPANCGFDVPWGDHFRTKFAGQPVKTVCITVNTVDNAAMQRTGEFIITANGVEGGIIYMVAAAIRDVISAKGAATVWLDLVPDRTLQRLTADLSAPRGKRTIATHLRRRAGISGVKAGLLYEAVPKHVWSEPARLAAVLKCLPLTFVRPRPLDESISTAGGVSFQAMDAGLMLRAVPGVFCAGEMLDWEAPTGGYLITACLATGRLAGRAAAEWAQRHSVRLP